MKETAALFLLHLCSGALQPLPEADWSLVKCASFPSIERPEFAVEDQSICPRDELSSNVERLTGRDVVKLNISSSIRSGAPSSLMRPLATRPRHFFRYLKPWSCSGVGCQSQRLGGPPLRVGGPLDRKANDLIHGQVWFQLRVLQQVEHRIPPNREPRSGKIPTV